MTKEIIGVYFDFFGTLIDSRYAITNVWSKIAKKLGMDIDYDDPRIWAGMLKQWEKMEKLADKLGKNYMEFSREVWDELNFIVLDTIGIKTEGITFNFVEEFRESFLKFYRLYPGCREMLNEIKDRNIKIGLHTHGSRERVQLKMKELRIYKFFDVFIHTQDFGYNKSNIEVYQIALGAMAPNDPDKIFHVGDNLELDVKMAQKIGMIPILFDPYNVYSQEEIRIIHELPEILKFL
ncbi:MAG: HAD family hydrolase [Candidatus Thorarchaeota archaeon]